MRGGDQSPAAAGEPWSDFQNPTKCFQHQPLSPRPSISLALLHSAANVSTELSAARSAWSSRVATDQQKPEDLHDFPNPCLQRVFSHAARCTILPEVPPAVATRTVQPRVRPHQLSPEVHPACLPSPKASSENVCEQMWPPPSQTLQQTLPKSLVSFFSND